MTHVWYETNTILSTLVLLNLKKVTTMIRNYKFLHNFPATLSLQYRGFATQTSGNAIVKNNILDPYYITGLSDGEACFYITFQKHSELVTGYQVRAGFSIGMHQRDKVLLEQIKLYFGVGEIFKQGKTAYQYRVSSLESLTNVIIPHFIKYPLITQKRADFELLTLVIDLMNNRKHQTLEGIQQIINIKASMNNGLSDTLKDSFFNINPVPRPKVEFSGIPSPH